MTRWFTILMTLCAVAVSGCTWERIERGDGCVPTACDMQGAECGEIADGCGGSLECGSCISGTFCGSAAFDNTCCFLTSCAEQSAECGNLPDGCGGTLDCGACGSGSCGGAGAPYRCGPLPCTAKTCAELGLDCGVLSDGCGDVIDCGSCAEGQRCGGGGLAHVCGESIAANTELVDGCFAWPGTPFGESNHAPARIGLAVGDTAIDFSLRTADDEQHSLFALLESRPVLLQLGSFTSSVFQESVAAMTDMVARYADRVHFVVVYTVEAHPRLPDPSPYRGTIWESGWSAYGQSRTLEQRRVPAQGLMLSDQLLLIDDLTPGSANNPVWCTYGPAQNAAFLIERDGTVAAAHRWLDLPSMELAIEGLLIP